MIEIYEQDLHYRFVYTEMHLTRISLAKKKKKDPLPSSLYLTRHHNLDK